MPKIKKRLSYRHATIGIVYDFDGTLSPNNMQEDTIFREWGIDKKEFWKKSDRLVAQGYERTLAYLSLLIRDPAFQKKPLQRKLLKRLACQIEYYPGVAHFFQALDRFLKTLPEVREWGIRVEHYVVSSGMKEILEGSSLAKYFKRIYACEYDYGPAGPVFPKLVINDTNKTQFLFRINKGKLKLAEDINSHMPAAQRRIPFENMIYVGDSDTDVPSMTLVKKYGGHTAAVFDPSQKISKKALQMVKDGRADHFAPADYSENSLLDKILKDTLNKMMYTIAHRQSARMSLEWVKKNKI